MNRKCQFNAIVFNACGLLANLLVGGALVCQTHPAAAQTAPASKPAETIVDKQKPRLYGEMSEVEKANFVSTEADRVLNIIGKTETRISADGKALIKTFVDRYAQRQSSAAPANAAESARICQSSNVFKSDLNSLFERGATVAPRIAAAFQKAEIAPRVGIYTAMIESEFCSCLKSPTGSSGLFMLAEKSAEKAGLIVYKDDAAKDERCQPAAAARGAAEIYRALINEQFKTEPNRVTLAVAAYNAGADATRGFIAKTESAESASFWTLLEHKDQLPPQFKFETYRYVPKFFAAAIVGENPAVFGVKAAPLSAIK